MFWKLGALIAVFLVNVEAQKGRLDGNYGTIKPEDYNCQHWRNDIYNVVGSNTKKNSQMRRVLDRLNRMNLFEQNQKSLEEFKSLVILDRSPRVKEYLLAHKRIAEDTTLLSKHKTVTRNIYDLLEYHVGCTTDEISKINRVAEIFTPESRLRNLLRKLNYITSMYCLNEYRELIIRIVKLIGKENFSVITGFYELIDADSLADITTNKEKAKSFSFKTVNRAISLYLRGLEQHYYSSPSTKLQLVEVYMNDVQKPCAMFCDLMSPSVDYFSNITLEIAEKGKYFEKLVKFCCTISSMGLSLVTHETI